MGLRQISCSFKSPSTETSVSYSCDSRYSCSLNHSSYRDLGLLFVSFEILLPVGQWVYNKSRVPLTTQAAEPTDLIRAIRDIRVRLSLQQQRPRSLIRIHSRYYFPLISGSTTNLVFVSLTRTFPLSLFALHSQTSLPVPTSPPSCISTARCPPQPRYSHRDHLSQPTYP